MASLNSAKTTAENYLDEIISTVRIRQSYSDIIVSQSGALFSALAHDSVAKGKLQEALKHKDTDTNSLYMALVVQANGAFEQYIRTFTSAVLEARRADCEKYSELEEDLRFEHIICSARVLSFLKKGDVNGQKFNFNRLMSQLGSCFSDSSDFYLSGDVFTILLGNCTPARLEGLFKALGLGEPFSDVVGENSKLKKRMKETKRAKVAKMTRDELDRQIDLRNTIVHGDLRPTVTLTDVNESVEFFSALIDAFDNLAQMNTVQQ
ncbi:hypothetical protein SAMN05446635_2665 [Burkholderia sp. OK233]|nr:hypothetical protein SAMN05446635_2665 [Burkholderia sp. OK233]